MHLLRLSAGARFVTPGGDQAELLLGDYGCARELKHRVDENAGGADGANGKASAGAKGGGKEGELLPAARGGWRGLRNDGGGTLYFTPPEIIEEEVQATSADVWAVVRANERGALEPSSAPPRGRHSPM